MADYLVHYNRNHNKKTGRFDFGDGDGDGIRNDHANQKKKNSLSKSVNKAVRTYDKLNRHKTLLILQKRLHSLIQEKMLR